MYQLLSILAVLVIISTLPIVSSEVMRGEFTVPNWVKNTAGWWASDQIPDSAFLQGIQYLINEGIMVVEIPAEIDSEATEEVPGWVKNTAGWWAEDKIHDITFVSGIKYLIGKGIIIVEQEVEEAEEPVEEVVEIKGFFMELNGANCCSNWAYVGEIYQFQIETFDDNGSPIDGVTVTAKIISKGGELRQNLGEVTTEDGIYSNSITIPNMDWYAGNILSVTGEYYGVEKTIEKEFEVLKKSGSNNRAGESAGSCAHVSPVSVFTNARNPQSIAFSKSGEKMFVSGDHGNVIAEYTLTGAYCIDTASFVDSLSVKSAIDPRGVAFSRSGERMFVVGTTSDDITEYILSEAWDVSSATSVDSLSVNSQDTNPAGIVFSKSGHKMFVVGHTGEDINEYTFPVNGTVSSASFVDSFSVSTQEENPRGMAFSKSGEKMFVVGSGGSVDEYTLSAAWDVSSASYAHGFSVESQENEARDVWFDSSGKTMFVVGITGDDINVYKLTVAWDVSSASHVS